MADLNSNLLDFFEKVKLSETKKKELKASRKAIRDDIKVYFKNSINEIMPLFYSQGSMAMGTTVQPLDEEYDIDDGIYLKNKNINFNNPSTWPSPLSIHNVVLEAVNPKIRTIDDKDPCVRVIYAKNYHVDLPIYIKDFDNNDFIPKLAHKTQGWIDSDPGANTNYYKEKENKYGKILCRLIVYLKTMIDYQNIHFGQAVDISGFEITLLTCREIANIDSTNNDEQILLDLCNQLITTCQDNLPLYKPVTQEDLWGNKDEVEKNKFIQLVTFVRDLLEQAIQEDDIEIAKKTCNDIWGDRFYRKNNVLLFPFGSLTHRIPIEWVLDIKGSVTIAATYSIKKGKPLPYRSTLLPKRASVWFQAHVNNISEPFDIKWQVTNTGVEALSSGAMRGDFIDSNHGKFIRTETTEYRGSHIVQCFIIKNGSCVAKSDEFYVNIK